MGIRNKDPCEPCRVKKIRCVHNLPQNPPPKKLASGPITAITPRKTRQLMDKPPGINLGDIPVFSSFDGPESLSTLRNKNLTIGARGRATRTPDLEETCSTKPVVIPRKRRLFRESPPSKFTKRPRFDNNRTENGVFGSEINVTVPEWITETLKTIPDYPSPVGAGTRVNFKNLFVNRRKSVCSSTNPVESAPVAEPEREESLMVTKASEYTNIFQGGHSSATRKSTEEIGYDSLSSAVGEIGDDGLKGMKAAEGPSGLLAPTHSSKGLAEIGVGDRVEVQGGIPGLQFNWGESGEIINSTHDGQKVAQQNEVSLDGPGVRGVKGFSNSKGLAEEPNPPVEIEPHLFKTAQVVDADGGGLQHPSTMPFPNMPLPRVNESRTDDCSSQGTDYPEMVDLVPVPDRREDGAQEALKYVPNGFFGGSHHRTLRVDSVLSGSDRNYPPEDKADVLQAENRLADVPEEDASERDALEMNLPEQNAPEEYIPGKKTHEQQDRPEQRRPEQGVLGKDIQEQEDMPEQWRPEQGVLEQGIPEQDIPEQNLSVEVMPEQGICRKDAQEQATLGQGAPDSGVSDQDAPTKTLPEKALLHNAQESSVHANVHFQKNRQVLESPERPPQKNTLQLLSGATPGKLQSSPVNSSGTSPAQSSAPWDRNSREQSLVTSDISASSITIRRRLWKELRTKSPAIPAYDRGRWRDPTAGPSRFSGPRIITPLRSSPLEPGMGFIDPTRYSQHEGLWNMVTNDYIAELKTSSKKEDKKPL